MRAARTWLAVAGAALAAAPAAAAGLAERGDAGATQWPGNAAVVTYASERAFRAALAADPAEVVRHVPSLRVAELRPRGGAARYAAALARRPGILRVEPRRDRRAAVEPALVPPSVGGPLQWQYAATRVDQVPDDVRRAAAAVTIAVIDTGADTTAPDLAAKAPRTYDVRTGTARVVDSNGHGTFVASLAAGSSDNGEGIAGAGGDARLMIVKAGRADGTFTDVDEAAAIVWAVDHGARILNLSLGGPETSAVERNAVEYAVSRGALLVAAVGNDYAEGNALQYPAALLQRPGSFGAGGDGLAVTASTRSGERAAFANTGSHLSLAAPGDGVFAAVSSTSSARRYPRVPLPGSLAGSYGFGSGTSYAAPQASGVAALVWAANPLLTAAEVADILERTASGRGRWTPETGFGVVDAAAAVAAARNAVPPDAVRVAGTRAGRRVTLSWTRVRDAAAFRVSVVRDGRRAQVLTPATASTRATYALPLGSTYRFTVAALDPNGSPTAESPPWTVTLRPAPKR